MISWVIWAGIAIGSAIYDRQKSNREKNKSLAEANKRLPGVDQIQFPIVTESDPIPVLFGTHWLRSPNVLWYGFVDTRQNNQDRENNVIRYRGCMLVSYCSGPVDYVLKINGDGTPVFTSPYFPIIDNWIDLTSGPVDFDVEAPNLWGDPYNGGGGGLAGRMTFLPGLPNQTTPQLFTEPIYRGVYPIGEGPFYQPFDDENGHPYMPAYRGLFTVLLGQYVPFDDLVVGDSSAVTFELGTSPVFRPIEIMAQRMYQRGFGLPQWYSQAVEIIGIEMNPAHIIHELLTDTVYGYGIGPDEIDDTINAPVSTFQNSANQLLIDSLGLSFVWGQQQSRIDVIKEILRHISAFLVRNPKTGKYELRLLRDDYNAANLPVFGPAQIEQVIRYTRPDASLLPTILEAKYMDRDTNIERVVRQDDQAGLLTRGEIREEVYYQLVARGEVAARIATNHMLELSAPLAVVELSIPYAFGSDLLPGDVFVWNWPDYGVEQMVLRVLSVTRGMLEDGNVRVSCREDAYAWRDTVYSEPPASQWVDPVLQPLPALSLGIELPLLLWVAAARDNSPWARIDDFANDNRGVASLFARPQNVAHVGYELYSEGLSNLPRLVDSGATWSGRVEIDGVFRPTSFGVDAEQATTLARLKFESVVPDVGDIVLLTSGSGKQPQEFVYIVARNFVSGAWELQIERALFDTDELFNTGSVDGSTVDPVGAVVGRLRDIDDPIQIDRKYSVDVPKDVVASGGESLLRALTYTGSGVLPFEDAIQVAVPIEGRPFKPIPPYIFNITEIETGTLILWRTRNRRRDRLVFTNEGVSVEADVTYTVRIFEVEPTPQLLHTETNIAGTAPGYLYTFVDEDKDRGGGLADVLRIEIDADRDGVMSYYTYKRIYKRASEPPPQESGDLYAWGRNQTGQLGAGDLVSREVPTLINQDDWLIISAGGSHSLGIKDGDLYAWGNNTSGQLGTNDLLRRTEPTLIDSEGWSMVSAGEAHSLGIKDGNLYAWGLNSFGQLGTGDFIQRTQPTFISSGWSMVSAGADYSLGIQLDSLYAWGTNGSGQLGTGDTISRNTPTLISSDWSMVSAGGTHSLGIKEGNLYAWGLNSFGQLGTGDFIQRTQPTLINQDDWLIISAGGSHSLGIKDGDLYAWGTNGSGQLGTGDFIQRTQPTFISGNWAMISAGFSHSLGIKEGNLYAWGLNSFGQLGTGGTISRNTPTLISSGWSAISAGTLHSLGIKSEDNE
jgi:alpha-tubulin suppressor-like RCC1 family protein